MERNHEIPVVGKFFGRRIACPNNLGSVIFIIQNHNGDIYRLVKVKGKKNLYYVIHSIAVKDRYGRRKYEVVYYLALRKSFDQDILKTVLENNIRLESE